MSSSNPDRVQQAVDQLMLLMEKSYSSEANLIAMQWLRKTEDYTPEIWRTLPSDASQTVLMRMNANGTLADMLPALQADLGEKGLRQAVNLRDGAGQCLLYRMLIASNGAVEMRSPEALPAIIRLSDTDGLCALDRKYGVSKPGGGLLYAIIEALDHSSSRGVDAAALASALRDAQKRLRDPTPDPSAWLAVRNSKAAELLIALGASLHDPVDRGGQRHPAWRALLNTADMQPRKFKELTGFDLADVDPPAAKIMQRFAATALAETNRRETSGYLRRFAAAAFTTLSGASKLVVMIATRPDLLDKMVSEVASATPAEQLKEWLAPDENGLTPIAYAMAMRDGSILDGVLRIAELAGAEPQFSETGKPWFQVRADHPAAVASYSDLRRVSIPSAKYDPASYIIHAREHFDDPMAALFGPKDQQQGLIAMMDEIIDMCASNTGIVGARQRAIAEMVWLLPHLKNKELDGLDPGLLDRLRFAAVCLMSQQKGGKTSMQSHIDTAKTVVETFNAYSAVSPTVLGSKIQLETTILARFLAEPPAVWTTAMLKILREDRGESFKKLAAKASHADWQAAADRYVLGAQVSKADPQAPKVRM